MAGDQDASAEHTSVMIKVEGPIRTSESFSDNSDPRHTSRADITGHGVGTATVLDDEFAEMLVSNDPRSFYLSVTAFDESPYYISQIDQWETELSGVHESRGVALAADFAVEDGEYETALQALIEWSHDEECPVQEYAESIAERAAEHGRIDELGAWYTEYYS